MGSSECEVLKVVELPLIRIRLGHIRVNHFALSLGFVDVVEVLTCGLDAVKSEALADGALGRGHGRRLSLQTIE